MVSLPTVRVFVVAMMTTVVFLIIPKSPASAAAEVTIEKLVNGERAETSPGPIVDSGSRVRFRYLITVHSAEPLYDFIVTDTGGVSPDCDLDGDGKPDGYNGHPGPLSAGSSFVCVADELAGGPGVTVASIGRVKAYDYEVSQSFKDDSISHYTIAASPTTAAPTTGKTSSSQQSATSQAANRTTATEAQHSTSTSVAPTSGTQNGDSESSIGGRDPSTPSIPEAATTLSGEFVGGQTDDGASGGGGETVSSAPDGSASTTGDSRSATTGDEQTTRSITSSEVPDISSNPVETTDAPGDDTDGLPSVLAFADDFRVSPFWSLAAMAVGAGLAVVGHRRDSENASQPRADA